MPMINQLASKRNYRLALFAILAMSSLVSIGLFAMRASTSDSNRYAFLVWNLFLAWIPFAKLINEKNSND